GTTLVWPGYAAPRSTRCECAARPEQRAASLQAAPRPHPPHAAGEHGGAGRQKTQPRHTGEGEEQEEKQEEEHKNGKTEGEYGYTGRSAHATLHIINGAARP
ncbi:unnamed protein product, partial [Prorocentrum cordatum]